MMAFLPVAIFGAVLSAIGWYSVLYGREARERGRRKP